MQREVGADADRDRQVLALLLGALERQPQMPAEVELDAGAVAAGDLQPVIGRVVGAGVGIAHDHDAGGDEASGVGGGVVERRQHAGEIDVLGVDVLLRGRPLDQHRRLRRPERAADEFADAVEVDAERGLAVRLAGQQVADHRHVVAVDRANSSAGPPSSFFMMAAISRCGSIAAV